MGTDPYEKECRAARKIACAPDGQGPEYVAQAIVACREHTVVCDGDSVTIEYHNEFGPTCTVDDVLERMTLLDWQRTFALVCHGLVGRKVYGLTSVYPTVTKIPEPDSPVTSRIVMTAKVPKRAYNAILKALEWRDKEDGQ